MSTPQTIHDPAPIGLDEIDRLAWSIEATGRMAPEADVARVVARARSAAVSPVVAAVLADPTEPEVARIRAFGLLALQLAATPRPHPHPASPLTPEPLAA